MCSDSSMRTILSMPSLATVFTWFIFRASPINNRKILQLQNYNLEAVQALCIPSVHASHYYIKQFCLVHYK